MLKLTGEQLDWLLERIPKSTPNPLGGRPPANQRKIVRGIFWMLDNGAKWKDLPRKFGSKSTVHRWFQKWVREGVFENIMREAGRCVEEGDGYRVYECYIDGMFAKAKGGGDGIGTIKAGKGVKIMIIVDSRGLPLSITTGSASPHESQLVQPMFDFMLGDRLPERLVGDKAYDSDKLDAELAKRGIEMIAPHRNNRKPENKTQDGRALRRIKRRWTVERTIGWLQNFRCLCIRWEKSTPLYEGFLHLSCTILLLRDVLKLLRLYCTNRWGRQGEIFHEVLANLQGDFGTPPTGRLSYVSHLNPTRRRVQPREIALNRNAHRSGRFVLLTVAVMAFMAVPATATDWPQWMGPTLDGNYTEAGVIDRIPADGLPIKWRKPINGGYSGPAVANGRVYVMDFVVTKGKVVNEPQGKPEIDGIERVLCLNERTGDLIWKYEYPANYRISYPGGPRCTPTVADGLIVTLGAHGDLCVLDAKDGTPKWRTSFEKDYGAPVPMWGFAGHPLVEAGVVYVQIGGTDQAVAAFDLQTGKLKWKAHSSGDAGYCPPVMIDAGGAKQLLVWHPAKVLSLNPKDGSLYWEVPLKPDFGMSIGRPQRKGDQLFIAGVMRTSVMLKLDDKKPAVTEVWRGESAKSLYPGNVTPMWGDGVIFGCDHQLGALIAIDSTNGERLWQTFEPVDPKEKRLIRSGSAFITRHTPSGNYFLFGESGNLSLAKMDRDGYHSLGSVNIVKPTTNAFGRDVVWSHPAYANRTVFLRNDKEIVAVDIAK